MNALTSSVCRRKVGISNRREDELQPTRVVEDKDTDERPVKVAKSMVSGCG